MKKTDIPGEKTYSQRCQEYRERYNKDHQRKNITVSLYSPFDDDIKDFIGDVQSVSTYLKALIRADMAIKKAAAEQAAAEQKNKK